MDFTSSNTVLWEGGLRSISSIYFRAGLLFALRGRRIPFHYL